MTLWAVPDIRPLYILPKDSLINDVLIPCFQSATYVGDRGYISKDLRERLRERGINLVYKVRKNMKPLDLSVSDEVLLRKRMLIESVIRVLKTQTQLEHSRHRSSKNFQVNVVSALIAYQLREEKTFPEYPSTSAKQ